MRDSLRAWQEQFETFALEVIFGERRGKKAALLRECSWPFQGVPHHRKGRRWLYEARIIRDHPLGVQVITVGNLTVGGTGKTPVVEKLHASSPIRAARLPFSPAAIAPNHRHSRIVGKINSYFRMRCSPRVVSDGKACCSTPKMRAMNPTCSPPISRTWSS